MAFGSVEEIVAGYTSVTSWRKSPSQTTVSGVWFDLSMSPGNPVPNYYASSPLVAATLNGGEGIFHGGATSPAAKYLKSFTVLSAVTTALPMPIYLLDYLVYYPFVDMATNDAQAFTNSTTLPRYTTGEALNAAGAAGDPWITAIPGSYGVGSAGKIVGDALAGTVVDGETLAGALRLVLAAMAGRNAGTILAPAYRSVDDSKTRITATINATTGVREDVVTDST